MVTKKELADLQEKVSKQEETIETLITKVKKLEGESLELIATMVTKKELADLQEKVSKQEETIKTLIKKVKKLEGDVIQINAEKLGRAHV